MPATILTRLSKRLLMTFGTFALIIGPLYLLPHIGIIWTGVYFIALLLVLFLATLRAAIPV